MEKNHKKYPQTRLKDHPEWITNEVNGDTIIWAESFAEYLSEGGKQAMTTSQIRNFFGELKRIQAGYNNYKNRIPMLKVQLAYSAGRQWDKEKKSYKTKVDKFNEELKTGIDLIIKAEENNKKNYFKNFVSLCEAIVAYHKFHGAD